MIHFQLKITDNFLESILLNVQREISKNLDTLNSTNDLHEDRYTITLQYNIHRKNTLVWSE